MSIFVTATGIVLTVTAGCGPSRPETGGPKRPETQPARRRVPQWEPELVGQITAHKEGLAAVDCGRAEGVRSGDLLVVYRNGRFVAYLKIIEVEDTESVGLVTRAVAAVRTGDMVTNVPLPARPEPRPEGKIVSIKDGIAALSVGWDDGVRVGSRLVIYNKDRFVGYVKIIEVEAKKSAGVLIDVVGALPDVKGPAQPVKPGDDALPPGPQHGAAGTVIAVGSVRAWLDIGANDGVRPASVLIVRRGGRTVCHVKASEVHHNFCSALILAGRGAAIKIGDEVILLPPGRQPGP
jgi:hypothetical protein